MLYAHLWALLGGFQDMLGSCCVVTKVFYAFQDDWLAVSSWLLGFSR